MAKVAAYHSTNKDDPDVYHVYDNCGPGSQIPAENRASGTGGYPLCGVCKKMS